MRRSDHNKRVERGESNRSAAVRNANREHCETIHLASLEILRRLKRAGASFVYGAGRHHLDMRTAISVYTCPEFVLARVAVAEMGRYYGLPTWGYAGDAYSCVVDEQAASEATFSILAALLSGNNLTHDIGYLESGKTSSPEMIILCDEIISMLRKFMAGIPFDEKSLAVLESHTPEPLPKKVREEVTYIFKNG